MISKNYNVSTFSLLYKNSLQAYCSDFPVPGKVCLPQSCDIYEIKKGDTCFDIVHANGYKFSQTQLMSWNPNINRGCSNLAQLEKSLICIRYEPQPRMPEKFTADRLRLASQEGLLLARLCPTPVYLLAILRLLRMLSIPSCTRI